jgi:hypothetical protein
MDVVTLKLGGKTRNTKHALESKLRNHITSELVCLVMCRTEKVEVFKMRVNLKKKQLKDIVVSGLLQQTYLRHSTLDDVSRRMRPRPCCEHRGGASPAAVGSNNSLLLTTREPTAPHRTAQPAHTDKQTTHSIPSTKHATRTAR